MKIRKFTALHSYTYELTYSLFRFKTRPDKEDIREDLQQFKWIVEYVYGQQTQLKISTIQSFDDVYDMLASYFGGLISNKESISNKERVTFHLAGDGKSNDWDSDIDLQK